MSRTLDIQVGPELVSIDLDSLETEQPDAYVELLKEANSSVGVWTRLAAEYWRKGNAKNVDIARQICEAAITALSKQSATLAPAYAMLANLKVAYAQRAPKMILENARVDKLSGPTKDAYMAEANGLMNRAMELERTDVLILLTRGILQLANRKADDAQRTFDAVLAKHPNNVVALTGRARILYQRRQYAAALKGFQRLLQLAPDALPDPRIGIGMCLWSLAARDKARMAWARSLEVHPDHYPALVLLGLASINASKDVRLPDSERAAEYALGIKFIERAFKFCKESAAAANALAEMFLRKGTSALTTALKLAERTIQHADTLPLLADGHMRVARALHAQGDLAEAGKHYEAAGGVLGAVGLAGVKIQTDEYAAATHVLEKLLQPTTVQPASASFPTPAGPKLEATFMLASLHAFARPGVSSTDLARGRTKARELYERAMRDLEIASRDLARASGVVGDDARVNVRGLGEEVAMHVEIARLWTEDPALGIQHASAHSTHFEKALHALSEALRIARAAGATGDAIFARLLNNVAALRHGEGAYEIARGMYEDALAVATGLPSEEGEGISVSVLYNLGRCLEDMEEKGIGEGGHGNAGEVYAKLLSRHGEYIDAKVRQAHILTSQNRMNEAHDLIKQALASAPHALNLRAYYTHFLLRVGMWKNARDFVFATLRDCDKNDVYALCAAGVVLYHQAREAGRGFGGPGGTDAPMSAEERKKNFVRACEFFEKALAQDPFCAVAAQGLAIALAEDALGTLAGALGPPAQGFDPSKAAREALDVFAKVRESLADGAVYANMGHCYYARDEFERAVESYETANKRFYEGRNVTTLLCLSRTWYAKANKDQSFAGMRNALKYAQQAMHLTPGDKAIVYNIAMIEQKAAEMLFGLEASKRTLVELKRAIAQAEHAQTHVNPPVFGSLAADTSGMLPYSRDIADQRRRYGDTMLRKRAEHLAKQEEYENEVNAKFDAARQRRQDEKERLEAAERERLEELRRQAEVLAEQRRKARAEIEELNLKMAEESEEERERKVAKKRARTERAAAEDLPEGEGGGQKKRKRTTKKRTKRGRGEDGDEDEGVRLPSEDEEDAMFSGPEDRGEAPAKRVPKKRVIKDDEDEDVEGTSHKRKKIKSKEVISDSDMDD
ncbi:TPR-like protein [Exidia glandulosa HHB12029]|uniref:TPR-like protein n=1 Tax=Exidia glandulosa HHB12029 TaxID=1314781 RepID=A0A165MI03_EXIGL|nr:TPR-like protein [Exidia glandulosa HHB12029]